MTLFQDRCNLIAIQPKGVCTMHNRLQVKPLANIARADAAAFFTIIALPVADGFVVRTLTKGRRQPVPGRTTA